MNDEHLTDGQIQEMLDSREPGSNAFLPWHLKACRRCLERYREFQRLYEGLAADPGFALPPGFADAVLARIPASRSPWLSHPALPIALACALGAMIVVGFSLFVNMKPLAQGTLRILDFLGQAFRPLAGPFRALFSWLGDSARPLLFGALGLSGAALVERLLQRQSLRRGH